jgi:hypothetical protein
VERGARGEEEEALGVGEGGVGGSGARGVHAQEARVLGEGDGIEEHVDPALPHRRRHQGVGADVLEPASWPTASSSRALVGGFLEPASWPASWPAAPSSRRALAGGSLEPTS